MIAILHLGGDIIISVRRVVAILNSEAVSGAAAAGHETERIGAETKSIVITECGGKKKVFFSPISTATLQRRCGFVKNIGF